MKVLKKIAVGVGVAVGTALPAFATGGDIDLSSVATQATTDIGSAVPVAVTVLGLIFAVGVAVKAFKRVAK